MLELVKTYRFGKWGYSEIEVWKDENGKRIFRVVNTVTGVSKDFDNWKHAEAEARYISDRYESIQKQMGW